jgi:hypothetical protein
MLISNKAHQDCESNLFENTRPKLVKPLTDTNAEADRPLLAALQREERSFHCPQENGFFKGLLVVLPVSILLWILTIWGITSLLH